MSNQRYCTIKYTIPGYRWKLYTADFDSAVSYNAWVASHPGHTVSSVEFSEEAKAARAKDAAESDAEWDFLAAKAGA